VAFLRLAAPKPSACYTCGVLPRNACLLRRLRWRMAQRLLQLLRCVLAAWFVVCRYLVFSAKLRTGCGTACLRISAFRAHLPAAMRVPTRASCACLYARTRAPLRCAATATCALRFCCQLRAALAIACFLRAGIHLPYRACRALRCAGTRLALPYYCAIFLTLDIVTRRGTLF
jgi:hypothetical protein